MKKRIIISSIVIMLIGIGAISFLIGMMQAPVNPIAFHCQISTNIVSGPPVITCVISNQSQHTVMVWDGVGIMQNGESGTPDAAVPYVNFPMNPKKHRFMYPGSLEEFKFQLPTTAGRILPKNLNTNQFRLCAQWSTELGARFEILLSKFRKPGKTTLVRKKLSIGNMITVTPTGDSGKD